ncbi:hypothetical protein [Mesobacterium pallidum]|uniref:hypothetical protein n=1 Tax=Mesobacterium pallidum TaxID=2872037 RepID=UPI001EE1A712|nr:hypothetical protein [Mesobacterium pallidum]
MSIDISEVGQRLEELEQGLREVRMALGSGVTVLDALDTLDPDAPPLDKPVQLPGGYVALSPELGVFTGSGKALVRAGHGKNEIILALFAMAGEEPPADLIVQVNLPMATVAGRRSCEIEAVLAADLDEAPRIEARFMAEDRMLKAEALRPYLLGDNGNRMLRATLAFDDRMARTETVTSLQFCMTLPASVLGGAVTRLRIC